MYISPNLISSASSKFAKKVLTNAIGRDIIKASLNGGVRIVLVWLNGRAADL